MPRNYKAEETIPPDCHTGLSVTIRFLPVAYILQDVGHRSVKTLARRLENRGAPPFPNETTGGGKYFLPRIVRGSFSVVGQVVLQPIP